MGTSNRGNTTSAGVSTLRLIEGRPSALRCIEGRPSAVRCDAVDGYPTPQLDLFVGMRDVTGFFFARYATQQTNSVAQKANTICEQHSLQFQDCIHQVHQFPRNSVVEFSEYLQRDGGHVFIAPPCRCDDV